MAIATNEEMVLARVYSASMLELAVRSDDAESLLDELREVSKLLASNEAMARFFSAPTVDAQTRAKAIERIFRGRSSDLLVNSLQVLNRKDRLSLFDAVTETYRLALKAHAGRTEATVTSAVPLSDEAKESLRAMIGKRCGKEIDLVEKIDGSLLGGLVIQIGDEKFDASIVRSIHRLSDALRERSLKETHGDRSHVA